MVFEINYLVEYFDFLFVENISYLATYYLMLT